MARTEQTGHKSTGGTAPQALSPPKQAKETSALIASADLQPMVERGEASREPEAKGTKPEGTV